MTTSMEGRRTVVVSGVPDVLEHSRMVDKLTIYFQSRRRSHGGDVENVKYPTNMDGVAFVTFDRVEDAEQVVRKEQHTMVDEGFTQDYALTVFPFSTDVFLYVPQATVDLLVFGSNQASLIESLQSAHRSIRFQAFPHQRKASIEGPFSAVQALREDLIRRASRLRPSSPTADVKPREGLPNRRPPSEKTATSCRDTKAKQEAAKSTASPKPPQSRGEAREVHSLISKGKTPAASFRQNVSNESLAGGSFRRADGEEIIGTVSPSGLRRFPVEDTFTKQRRDDSFSPKHSLPAIQSSADFSTDPSSPMRNSTFRQNHLRKGSTLSAATEDTSKDIWVDLYIFRYIENFHKEELNRCLKGVDTSTMGIEELGIMRISLTEKQPSEATSRTVRDAVENLETLLDFWHSILRVHEVFYNKAKLFDKQKLIQICNDMTSLHSDVLYVFEESCIKVIGPSVASHLFCKKVEDCIDKYSTGNPIIRKSKK
ncbi:uncharacterized protein V3H82_023630 [Fundulus diaphanus]